MLDINTDGRQSFKITVMGATTTEAYPNSQTLYNQSMLSILRRKGAFLRLLRCYAVQLLPPHPRQIKLNHDCVKLLDSIDEAVFSSECSCLGQGQSGAVALFRYAHSLATVHCIQSQFPDHFTARPPQWYLSLAQRAAVVEQHQCYVDVSTAAIANITNLEVKSLDIWRFALHALRQQLKARIRERDELNLKYAQSLEFALKKYCIGKIAFLKGVFHAKQCKYELARMDHMKQANLGSADQNTLETLLTRMYCINVNRIMGIFHIFIRGESEIDMLFYQSVLENSKRCVVDEVKLSNGLQARLRSTALVEISAQLGAVEGELAYIKAGYSFELERQETGRSASTPVSEDFKSMVRVLLARKKLLQRELSDQIASALSEVICRSFNLLQNLVGSYCVSITKVKYYQKEDPTSSIEFTWNTATSEEQLYAETEDLQCAEEEALLHAVTCSKNKAKAPFRPLLIIIDSRIPMTERWKYIENLKVPKGDTVEITASLSSFEVFDAIETEFLKQKHVIVPELFKCHQRGHLAMMGKVKLLASRLSLSPKVILIDGPGDLEYCSQPGSNETVSCFSLLSELRYIARQICLHPSEAASFFYSLSTILATETDITRPEFSSILNLVSFLNVTLDLLRSKLNTSQSLSSFTPQQLVSLFVASNKDLSAFARALLLFKLPSCELYKSKCMEKFLSELSKEYENSLPEANPFLYLLYRWCSIVYQLVLRCVIYKT